MNKENKTNDYNYDQLRVIIADELSKMAVSYTHLTLPTN